MSIDPKVDAKIEGDMAALVRLLRTGMSFNDYTGEFTDLIGQAKEDKKALVDSGLGWDIIEKSEAYLEKLAIEHGNRIASEGMEAEVEEQFRELMPRANAAKKIMMVVLRYIIARTQDKDIMRAYDMIRKGYGNMDTLHDILAGTSIIYNNLEYLSQVRPGGQEITQKHIDDARALATKLIDMRGEVTAAADDGSEHVDCVNRLLTLCILAQREIKLFAEIAFYDNPEHYDRHYASDRSTGTVKKQKKIRQSL
jgi:hypothetical protein